MIRQMSMDDLQVVEALEQHCFRSSWNEEQLRYELEENAFSHALVLEEAGEIVGSMIYWTIFETCQLCRIAVSPDQRRKGSKCFEVCSFRGNRDCSNYKVPANE